MHSLAFARRYIDSRRVNKKLVFKIIIIGISIKIVFRSVRLVNGREINQLAAPSSLPNYLITTSNRNAWIVFKFFFMPITFATRIDRVSRDNRARVEYFDLGGKRDRSSGTGN